MHRSYFPLRFAAAVGAIATSLAVAAPIAHADTWPKGATRVAVEDDYLPDIVTALGLKPVAAISDPTPSGWMPAFQPFASGVTSLGEIAGSTDNLEALASVKPQAIIAPASLQATAGSDLSAVAPTIYYDATPLPAVNSAGQVISAWKLWLYQVATQIGRVKQANQVVTNLGVRAAAIRGQAGGQTFAYLRLNTTSTWLTGNDNLPVSQVFIQDLGMKNIELPASDYAAGCAAGDTPPIDCQSNALSMEVLPSLSSAKAIIVQDNGSSSSDISTFETNPLYTALPAVKSGNVAESSFYTRLGPLGVGYAYSSVVTALKLHEDHTTLAGGNANGNASLTFNPATKKVCVAAAPTGGKHPTQPFLLTLGTTSPAPALTLAEKPRYTATPQTSTSVGITTATQHQYTTMSCATAKGKLVTALNKTPRKVGVTLGTSHGTIASGAAAVVASS